MRHLIKLYHFSSGGLIIDLDMHSMSRPRKISSDPGLIAAPELAPDQKVSPIFYLG